MLTKEQHEQLRKKVIEQMPTFPENVQRYRPIPEWLFWGGMISIGVLIFTFMFLQVYEGMTR